jgi:diguanylate cyclase (GGDEF)-like protein/PAS domain S-box-containing protein
MNIFTSLRAKLVLSHLGAIFLANILLGGAAFYLFSKNLLTIEQDSLQSVSRHSASMVAEQLRVIGENLQFVANGREVKGYLQNFRDDALVEYFSLFQNTFPSIAFINQNGVEEVRVVNGISIEPVADGQPSEYVSELLAHPNEPRVFWGRNWKNESAPVLQLGLAFFDYFGNTFTAILQAEVPYVHLLHNFSHLSIGKSGYLTLLDTKGNMILYSPQSTSEKTRLSFQKYDIQSSPFSLSENDFLQTNFLGKESLLSSSPVEGSDFYVVAVLPYQEITVKLNELFRRILPIFLFVTLFGAILASLLARNISRPITHLTRITRDIVSGKKETINFSDIHSNDEIDQLMTSFQEMLGNLQRTTVSRDFMDNILEAAGESVLVLTPSGKIRMANNASYEILGYDDDRLLGHSIADILSPNISLNEFLASMKNGQSKGETTYRSKEGNDIPVLLSAALLPHTAQPGGIVCVAADISQLINTRQALDDNQRYLQSMMEALPTALMIIDAEYHMIIDVNPTACVMFGASREDIIGKTCHQFICPAEQGQCPVTSLKEDHDLSERTMLTASGEKRSILKSVQKITISGSTLLVEAFVDITDRKLAEEALRESEEKLRHISITDELTGLLNRRGFMTLARKQLQIISRTGAQGFLLYADVDNLKWINDTLGHAAGDVMICDTAEVLQRVCRKSDIVSRLGGDEFAILLTASDNESAIISRLNKEIAAVNTRAAHNYRLSISTGIVRCDPREKPFTIERFMTLADTKMYITKKEHKKNDSVYKH